MTNTAPTINDLFPTAEALDKFNNNVEHFIRTAEADYAKHLERFQEKFAESPAHAIAWGGTDIIQAEFEATLARQFVHVRDNEPITEGSLALAAVLVIYHEYERYGTDSTNLANSTGHGHRFVSMAQHEAKANFFRNTLGWKFGYIKLLSLLAFVEGFYEARKQA